MNEPMKVVRLKATLQDIQPAIWRRLEVPASLSLHGLHKVLQAAFGWSDRHLHEFQVQGVRLALPDPEADGRVLDSRKRALADLEGKVQAFEYTYDFGDDWVHQIEIEAWAESEPRSIYPWCLDGARACPPEDCGGPPGYEELCQALADPKHERHQELKAWMSEIDEGDKLGWVPEVFDLAGTNRVLGKLRLPKPKAT